MIRLERSVRIEAPRERVWQLVSDHERLPAWFPAREVVRRRPGSDDPDGVGAARVARLGGLAVEEVVTAFKPEERLELSLVAGAPLRDLRTEIRLTPEDGGTRVRWTATGHPLLPGTGRILTRLLATRVDRGLAGLARRARDAGERAGEGA